MADENRTNSLNDILEDLLGKVGKSVATKIECAMRQSNSLTVTSLGKLGTFLGAADKYADLPTVDQLGNGASDDDLAYLLQTDEEHRSGWYIFRVDKWELLIEQNADESITVDDLELPQPSQVPDTTPPIITVTDGDVDIEINKGATFDPLEGVSAHDDIDGDITNSILIGGSVDTNTVGDYTLVYKVFDKAGNEGELIRKITVKEVVEIDTNDPLGDGSQEHYFPFDTNAMDVISNREARTQDVIISNNWATFTNQSSSKVWFNDDGNGIYGRGEHLAISFVISLEDLQAVIFNDHWNTGDGDNGYSDVECKYDGSKWYYSPKHQDIGVSDNMPLNTEVHMVIVENGEGSYDIYRNGVKIGHGTWVNDTTPYIYSIGSFKGKIRDFRLFNRPITQEEITKLYNFDMRN